MIKLEKEKVMYRNKCVVWFLLCFLSIGSSVVLAQPVAYVGGGWGSSSVDTSGYDNAGSYKIYLGNYFSKNAAVELAYTYLGKFYYDEANGGYTEAGGYELTLVGNYPVSDDISFLARAGACAWNAELWWQGAKLATDDGTGLTYGVGLSVGISDALSFQLDYQKYDDVSGGNLDSIFGSLAYKF